MKKNRRFDLRKYHVIFTEIGIICALLFFIAATNVNQERHKNSSSTYYVDDSPVVLDLPPTIPPKKLPPQKPMIFTPEPEHDLIDPEIPEFPEFGEFTPIDIRPPSIEEDPNEETVSFIPNMPTIIGGQKALYDKIIYPEIAKKTGIEGRVAVQFIIDKKGNVTEPEIIRGVHPKLDEEVLRIIRLVKFSPGVQNGVLVKVKMVQTINFKLKR